MTDVVELRRSVVDPELVEPGAGASEDVTHDEPLGATPVTRPYLDLFSWTGPARAGMLPATALAT